MHYGVELDFARAKSSSGRPELDFARAKSSSGKPELDFARAKSSSGKLNLIVRAQNQVQEKRT